jgi:hypothetical protein
LSRALSVEDQRTFLKLHSDLGRALKSTVEPGTNKPFTAKNSIG